MSAQKPPAKVYFIALKDNEPDSSIAKKTKHLLNQGDFLSSLEAKQLVAVKQHFGEQGNKGYIKPVVTKGVVNLVKAKAAKPVVVETNTLYHGARANSYDHLMTAYEHGFSIENLGAPVVIMDGLNGQNQQVVPIDGTHFKQVYVAPDLLFFDALVVLSHVKGHMASGMGAAIKNLSMGFSSRAGKLAQHADYVPSIDHNACTSCGLCTTMCPGDALSMVEQNLELDRDKCIGCGECFTVCRSGALSFNWGAADNRFQEKMAEYALGTMVHHKEKAVFLNYFCHVSQHCDCWGGENPVLASNVGIFASTDPVAIDKASFDIGKECLGEDVFKRFWPEIDPLTQVKHGEAIGLGTQSYDLIKID